MEATSRTMNGPREEPHSGRNCLVTRPLRVAEGSTVHCATIDQAETRRMEPRAKTSLNFLKASVIVLSNYRSNCQVGFFIGSSARYSNPGRYDLRAAGVLGERLGLFEVPRCQANGHMMCASLHSSK